MCAGEDLAQAASQSLDTKMEYEEIDDEKARELLDAQSSIDESEKEYLLDYYSLVREGKTNYVSTTAFKYITSAEPTLPSEFFEAYTEEFKPKKRKVGGAGGSLRGRRKSSGGQESAHGHAEEEKGQGKAEKSSTGKRARK